MTRSEHSATNRTISQLVSPEGTTRAAAMATPGCFIHDGVAPEIDTGRNWGKVFSEPRKGNKVSFYVTGDEYFTAVANAIETASHTIYITGWQINFDVELRNQRTLFEFLEAAMERNKSLKIYVMPWLSPKVGVDTGDFETMLAIFQLNAGSDAPARAFALPAIAQSDMKGALGIGFSHHQKLVVVDNERAFVGGIDLAYGRRDNGKFSLAHNGRTGNEIYNTCIPPVEEMSHVEQRKYLTRAELAAACLGGVTGWTGTFIFSGAMKPVAYIGDGIHAVKEPIQNTVAEASKWWDTVEIMPEFFEKLKDIPVDKAQELSQWAYGNLDKAIVEKLDRLRLSGSAHAHDASAAFLAWFNNASADQLPQELRTATVEILEAFVIGMLSILSSMADARGKRYKNLRVARKMLPVNGKTFSSSQPRMPWHDVHSSIQGPSVNDLSRNFILRWNSIAARYEKSQGDVWNNGPVNNFFRNLGLKPIRTAKFPRISGLQATKVQPVAGNSWVQVLRSAPLTMQREEYAASGKQDEKGPRSAQNNCLKAMLTVIAGAQKFIYIENQFFQSDYEKDSAAGTKLSGPMAALLDIKKSPNYEKYAEQLNILGLPADEILSSIRWSQVDNVKKDANGGGGDFLNDLNAVIANLASIKASKLMGADQDGIKNPIAEALAKRIEAAIMDGLPFHVYIVLPAHPEGTLNTLNIMTQLHLTMQSVVLSDYSLVNRVRRAMFASTLRKKNSINAKQAKSATETYSTNEIIKEIGDDWKKFVTLLNLRSWDILDGRAVTEQIYVHSKLLIADDRVAILGSANINDRSQLGDRDSELAIIVRDDERLEVKLDGVDIDVVSANVHNLRIRLWKKIFGFTDGAVPASSLKTAIDHPAAPASWKAIQEVATANSVAYHKSFKYLANASPIPVSIWPTWNKNSKRLDYQMPFNECFWRNPKVKEESYSWDSKKRAPETKPSGIQGFIVSLPLNWTLGENNISGMNLTLLANIEKLKEGTARLAQLDSPNETAQATDGILLDAKPTAT